MLSESVPLSLYDVTDGLSQRRWHKWSSDSHKKWHQQKIDFTEFTGHWLELKWIRGWEQLKYLIQPIPSTRCTMYTKCKCSQCFWQYCFLKTASIMLNQGWMDWWSFGIHRGVDCSIEGRCTMYIKGKWLSPNLSFSRFNPCTICCLIASSHVTWRNYI